MLHEFDGLVPGTFFGAIWFVSVALFWLVWRLVPHRWQRTSHIVRYGLLLWVVAGLYFAFAMIGAIVAGLLGLLLLFFAIRGFPHHVRPQIVYLPRWRRVLRIATKAVVLVLVMLAFLGLAYLSLYAWYATPSPPDFGAFAEPGSHDVQSKAGYLFFWLIAPFVVVLAALAEWFRRPLCEDSLSGFDYYWRAFMTVVLAALFAFDAYDNPVRAIRAAQVEVTASSVRLPCPPLLVDCRAARLVQNR